MFDISLSCTCTLQMIGIFALISSAFSMPSSSASSTTWSDHRALSARKLLHESSFATVSTNSHNWLEGYPFATIKSISDGPSTESSGIPYFYASGMNAGAKDMLNDTKCSMSMSLAQSDECKNKEYDPEDPRCVRLVLTGQCIHLTSKDDVDKAKEMLFVRHPVMEHWPQGSHDFMFFNMEIEKIWVLDFFGGVSALPLQDYWNITQKELDLYHEYWNPSRSHGQNVDKGQALSRTFIALIVVVSSGFLLIAAYFLVKKIQYRRSDSANSRVVPSYEEVYMGDVDGDNEDNSELLKNLFYLLRKFRQSSQKKSVVERKRILK